MSEHTFKSLSIELPIPSRNLSPNGRPHWAAKHRSTQKAKSDAETVCRIAMGQNGIVGGWLAATVRVTWFYCGIQPDRDNTLASLKAYFDGLQAAGLIANDKGLTYLPVELVRVKKRVEAKVLIDVTKTK